MVNAPVRVKNVPAKGQSIESLLDIILQVLNVIQVIFSLLGIKLNILG